MLDRNAHEGDRVETEEGCVGVDGREKGEVTKAVVVFQPSHFVLSERTPRAKPVFPNVAEVRCGRALWKIGASRRVMPKAQLALAPAFLE